VKQKRWLVTAAVLLLALPPALRADAWLVNADDALRQARAENKFVLLDFTGSDWCGWCKRLKAEVFSTSVFEDYAHRNLVCVHVDFPRQRALSVQQTERNQQLARLYNIRGFPTLVLLDSAGAEVGRTGYQPGGAESYIQHLDTLLAPHRKQASPLETLKTTFSRSEDAPPEADAVSRLWLCRNGDGVEGRLIKREGDRIHVLNRKDETVILNLADLDAEDRAFVENAKK
jgi:protein disulfide-isomerase